MLKDNIKRYKYLREPITLHNCWSPLPFLGWQSFSLAPLCKQGGSLVGEGGTGQGPGLRPLGRQLMPVLSISPGGHLLGVVDKHVQSIKLILAYKTFLTNYLVIDTARAA